MLRSGRLEENDIALAVSFTVISMHTRRS
jgi:hypothetical protein